MQSQSEDGAATTLRGVARDVDALLRGRFTEVDELAAGRVGIPVRTLFAGALGLGAAYGVFMGLFASSTGPATPPVPIVAAVVKVPLLFLSTLAITYPSLYVFSALVDCRLSPVDTLKLLLGAIVVNLAVVASLGPVTGFFTLSTTSYPFMVLLNVAFFTVGGAAGLTFLRRSLRRVFGDGPPRTSPAADERHAAEVRTFHTWIGIYCLVGAQMAWILRPFIGSPHQPYTLFRPRTSNFFEAVWNSLQSLLG